MRQHYKRVAIMERVSDRELARITRRRGKGA
jgi:hypothetical protein